MHIPLPKLSFRKRLFFLFFIFSVLPLLIIAAVTSIEAQKAYQKGLVEFFNLTASSQEHILMYFFESNKQWAKSIASQNLLSTEVERLVATEAATLQSGSPAPTQEGGSREKLFASLSTIAVENPFIEKVFIADTLGNVLVSTTTDDLGTTFPYPNVLNAPQKERKPFVGKMYETKGGSLVIPFSAPILRRRDNAVIAVLVAEFKSTVIRSLLAGSLYSQSIQSAPSELSGDYYLVDGQGNLLTEPSQQFPAGKLTTVPVKTCQTLGENVEGSWTSPTGKKVFGLSRCLKLNDFTWTLIVEQLPEEAYQISNQLVSTILAITGIATVGLLLALYGVTNSITRPIRKLITGTTEFAHGNFGYRMDVQTGDELEGLAEAFNVMAKRLTEAFSGLSADKELISAERNKLAVVLSGVRDAVIAVDTQQRVIEFNKAAEALTSLYADDVRGKPIGEILKVFYKTAQLEVNKYCPIRDDEYEGIIFQQKELRIVTKNDHEFFADVIAAKIKEGKSCNLGCILTLHDFTKERQLEEMKIDFVSMAAHELRTPLTSIRGYTQLLTDALAQTVGEREKTFLQRLAISEENLGTLIDNLLNVSRIEKGTFTIEPVPCDIASLTLEVVDALRTQAAQKRHIITFEPAPSALPFALADRFRIRQVLSNLLANAISYTPDGGKISVEIKQDGPFILVSVTDNGIGIAPEAQHKLFTKFFRVSGPLGEGSKGTGLGLFISKSIIDMHGGQIHVNSIAGAGSVFTFSLPVATAQQMEEHAKVHVPGAMSLTQRHGIMWNKERLQKRLGTQ